MGDPLETSWAYIDVHYRPWRHWSTVQQPVLVIAGTDDATFLAGQEYLVSCVPNAEIEYVQGVSHTPQIEAPQQYRNAVLSFLRRKVMPATNKASAGVASNVDPDPPDHVVDFCRREGIVLPGPLLGHCCARAAKCEAPKCEVG